MSQHIMVKNMVCPRCIESVQSVFEELNLAITAIALGKVTLKESIDTNQKAELKLLLAAKGFELLDDKQTQIINAIKSIIIEEIHHKKELSLVNFSTLLAEKLHYDYAYLSRLFSTVEGRTIEKFILAQKIEKVKELLTYDEMTLTTIAFQMNYSSAAYLSSQFKKITGMSPSDFKKLQAGKRQFLDEV